MMISHHPEQSAGSECEREQQRLRQHEEKMRSRCQAALEVTIAHLKLFALQAEVVDIELLETIEQMEDALLTLVEGIEPLNNPAYHIHLLRQIRKQYPLQDTHDSDHPIEEGLLSDCPDERGDLSDAEAIVERAEEEPGKTRFLRFQGGQATIKDAPGLGKLVELDRYRDQTTEGLVEAERGGLEATGSHRLHEVAPGPTRRQHHVDKLSKDFRNTDVDEASDGEVDGAYVSMLGFVAGHLHQLKRTTVNFFATIVKSELYDFPRCS